MTSTCPTCGSSNPSLIGTIQVTGGWLWTAWTKFRGRWPVYAACPDRWHDRQGM